MFTGKLLTVEPGVTDKAEETETAPQETPSVEPVDLSNAVLSISYKTTNGVGETLTETLFEGPFDGEFMHVLHIDGQATQFPEPTEIEISLQITEDSDPMTINTVIKLEWMFTSLTSTIMIAAISFLWLDQVIKYSIRKTSFP